MFSRTPDWPAFTTMAASAQARATGATASAASLPTRSRTVPRPGSETTEGSAVCASDEVIALRTWPSMPGPAAPSVMSPTSRTTAPLRSLERATCPFLRASWRRLGVGFSVFSPPPPPAMSGHLQGAQRVGDGALHAVGEPAGDKRQRDADEQQPDGDLRREADAEDVELRHDARHQAEGGVGEHDGQQHRAGDLDRGGEDPDERGVDAATRLPSCGILSIGTRS